MELEILTEDELKTCVKVDEAVINITITNEGDIEDPEYWYQMDISGLESECSGEIPDYDREISSYDFIIEWVVKHEYSVLKMFKEIDQITDFAFRIIIEGNENWINLQKFNAYVSQFQDN